MTGIISVGGLITTPLLMTYFYPDQIDERKETSHIYQLTFDYHNYSEMILPITSLGIYYRVFNSNKLQHPDPYFVGIYVTREALSKDEYKNNDSMWKINAYQGYEYNEWNVSTMYGTYTDINPEIYVHHTYIAYEVTLFSQLLLDACSNSSEVNIYDYNYPTTKEYPPNPSELLIPGKWVLSVDIGFENDTVITIDVHQDGWMKYIHFNCIAWGTTEDGNPYCYGRASIAEIYKEYGSLLDKFHEIFGEYARTHINWVNKG